MTGQLNNFQRFKTFFEKKCIRLFVEAYNQSIMDKSIKLDWNENDITTQLHEYIDKNPLRRKSPPISTNIEQHIPNKSVKKERGYAAKNYRIDLRFVTFYFEEECKTFFEAKNLKEDTNVLNRYIETGINNFISEKYPYGFLVGYLLEGTIFSTIENGINELLKKSGRERECLRSKKHHIVEHYYESKHSELCLRHLIFDFTRRRVIK
jgi:hypothetical protein